MTIIPLQNYVLLEELIAKSGDSPILIADDANIERPALAKVLEVGQQIGNGLLNPSFKNGDTVLYQRHLFEEVTLDKKKFLIGKSDGIVAVIQE